MKIHCLLFTFFILILSYSRVSAQDRHRINSLKSELLNNPHDTTKIEIWGMLSWTYLGTRIKMDTARMYADSITEIAKKINSGYAKAKSEYYYGVADRLDGKYSSALDHIEAYINYHESVGDSSRVAGGLYQKSSIEMSMGNYPASLNSYFRVLAIEEADDNDYSIAYTNQSIGIVMQESGRTEDALAYFEKAKGIFSDLKENMDLANVLINIGNANKDLGQLNEAENQYNAAHSLYHNLNSNWGKAMAFENLGYLSEARQNYDSAFYFHQQALKMRLEMPENDDLVRSLLAVGDGYIANGKHKKAGELFQQGLNLSRQTGSKKSLRDTHLHFSELYQITGEFSKALDHRLLYEKYKDSILNEETNQQISQIKTQYETEKKDQGIALLTAENKTLEAEKNRQELRKNSLAIALLLFGILAALILFIIRQRFKNRQILQLKNEELRVSKMREELHKLELKALRAQMNPHFLFNSINSINTLILAGESEDASDYLTKFSKLVRMMLENSGKTKISLADELTMLESYLKLESIRFQNSLDYHIEVDENLDVDEVNIPSMVIQPFVENALWHGLLHSERKGEIIIKIEDKHKYLNCTITDNGIGREKSTLLKKGNTLVKKQSLGIQITRDRLELMNRRLDQNLIEIEDLKDEKDQALGTRVNIAIPI